MKIHSSKGPFKSILDVYTGCTLEGLQILGKVNAHIYSGAKQIFSDLFRQNMLDLKMEV